jgi:hypothetical protein
MGSPLSLCGAWFGLRECVCCLLVPINSVTFTPQWIRQPKPRDVEHDVCVCVFACECVLGNPRAFQPLHVQRTYTHAYTRTHVQARTQTSLQAHTNDAHTHTHTQRQTDTQTDRHVHTHTHTHTHMHMHMHTHTHTHTHERTHAHIGTYTSIPGDT